MMKTLLSLLTFTFLVSCSTSKQIEKSLSAGNYDQAIYDAIGKLQTNKDKKGKADFIAMLQEAYNKANERDLNSINFLKKDTDDVLLFPDHHSFSEKDVETILTTAKGRKIVTTEKDYMRLQDKIGANQLWYLPITIEMIENQDQFDKLIYDYVG